MASRRTQIYLTGDQREQLDVIRRRDRKSLAQVIREAVDAYLGSDEPDVGEALRQSFGSMPDLDVPSRDEWDRGHG